MNRRGFLKAFAAFAILPSALTYARSWTRAEILWKPADNLGHVDWLIQETHYLNGQIAKALSEHSLWLTTVKGGAFPT